MAVQIANPQVIAKIERLSQLTGLGKTAAVEAALNHMLSAMDQPVSDPGWGRFDAVLTQLHRLPPRQDAYDAVEYDENGLPK